MLSRRIAQSIVTNLKTVGPAAQFRPFGAKGKPAAGGAPDAAAAVAGDNPFDKRPRTMLQELVDTHGVEAFLFGPPSGLTKMQNAHRDYVYPKLANQSEFLAKKMREQYMREGTMPGEKIYFDPVRERQPDDTLQKLHAEKLVAAVIGGREEFEDVDLVMPARTPFTIRAAEHGMVRPFVIRHNDEEITVTCERIERHFKTEQPVLIKFQRYVPGRPNLLTIPLIPVQEDKSLHFQAGCQFHYLQREIQVWCYTEHYPPVVEVDCSSLSPNMPIKVGDIELRLPHGMFLHRDYERKRFHSIVKLTETNSYIQRKNQVIEQEELLREEQRKIAKRLLETGPQKAKKTTGLNVPIYIQSSKHIMAEKKIAQAGMKIDEGKKKGK